MEPRWCKKHWKNYTFVGGTQKADLWVYSGDNPDVRIVWGEDTAHWHWLERGHWLELGKCSLSIGTDDLLNKPTTEELEEVQTYLSLFAPWVFEVL